MTKKLVQSLLYLEGGVKSQSMQNNNKLTFKDSLNEPKYDIHRKFNKVFEFHSHSKLCYASLIVMTGYQGEART